MSYCEACGREMPESAKFCAHCGKCEAVEAAQNNNQFETNITGISKDGKAPEQIWSCDTPKVDEKTDLIHLKSNAKTSQTPNKNTDNIKKWGLIAGVIVVVAGIALYNMTQCDLNLNGDRYKGTCSGGLPDGKGIYTNRAGDQYEGEFRRGEAQGRGIFIWRNGNRYEGSWSNNKQNGKGVFTSTNGFRFEGEWVDNEASGYGTLYNKDGSINKEGRWYKNEYLGP